MLRVHVLVLSSTWDYLNLPEAPADTKAFRALLPSMERRGREGNRWVLKNLQKEQREASATYWGNTLQRQDALRENTLPVVQAKPQLTADFSRTRGVSPSSGKHSVPWSLSYALTARSEPHATFHPLKNEPWGRDRKLYVHVGLKNCLFPYRKESDYGELRRSREYMTHDSLL